MQALDLRLFQAALGLSEPWQVVSVEFDPAAKRLDLRIDFEKGSRFACPFAITNASNSSVNPDRSLAHGTSTRWVLCSGQATRGTLAVRYA